MGSYYQDDGESSQLPQVLNQRYFSLKWNNFENQLLLSFSDLYMTKEFTDMTLICDTRTIRAHKIVLSMCSPYFRQILKENPLKHPTIILEGVSFEALTHVLEFIYLGKVVCVSDDQIQSFIETAEFLQLDGVESQQKGTRQSQDVSPPSFSPPPQTTTTTTHSSTLLHQLELPPADFNNPPPPNQVVQPQPISAIEALCNLNRTVGLSPHFSNPAPHHRLLPHHLNPTYNSMPFQIPSSSTSSSSTVLQQQLSSHTLLNGGNYGPSFDPLHIHQQYDFDFSPPNPIPIPNPNPSKSNKSNPKPKPTKRAYKRATQSKPLNLAPKRAKPRAKAKPKTKKAKKSTGKEKPTMSQIESHNESQAECEPNEPNDISPDSSHNTNENNNNSNNVQLFTTETGIVVTVLGQNINALLSQKHTEEETNQSRSPIIVGSQSNSNSNSNLNFTPVITITDDDDDENESPSRLSPSPTPSSTSSLQIALSPPPNHPSELSPSQFHHFPIKSDNLEESSNRMSPSSQSNSNYPYLNNNRDCYYGYDSSNSPNSKDSASSRSSRASGGTVRPAYIQYSGAFPHLPSLSLTPTPNPKPNSTPPQNTKNKQSGNKSTHPISKGPNGSSGSQPLKYTSAEVRALVDSVANVTGHFVPCKLCEKVVKRERLRSHIYECHLVNGQKINCPYCGVGLKSKGSYRVHVWRHRKGSLKNSGGINVKQVE